MRTEWFKGVIGTLHMHQPGPSHVGAVRLVSWTGVWGLAQLMQDAPLGQAKEERGGSSFQSSQAAAMQRERTRGHFFGSKETSLYALLSTKHHPCVARLY